MIEFQMPSLGADMEDGTLVEWRKKPGDTVKRGDIIADVETQKGLIEIEVFDEGRIEKFLIKEGEKIPVGTVMAHISAIGKESAVTTPAVKKAVVVETEKKTETIVSTPATYRPKISPLAKKMAQEKGIDVSGIKGTGEGGSITKTDIEKISSKKEEFKKTIIPAENIRRAVAAAMSRSNREIPHYYLETKVDMSKMLAWLAETNKQRPVQKRILPAALLIKAVARALKEVPDLNAVWENELQQKKKINIGVVISLRGGGIIVPAIQDADKKNADEIMEVLSDLIPRARAMKLRSSELSESTITVTNLGDNNAETVYGIIYPPQVALVGFGSITEQPWAENGMLDVRPVLNVTLSADHRATDGHTGGRFLMALKTYLNNPDKL